MMMEQSVNRYREHFFADGHHREIRALSALIENMKLLEVSNKPVPLSVYTPVLSRDSHRALMRTAVVLERCIIGLLDIAFGGDFEAYFDTLGIPVALRHLYKRTWGRNAGLMSRADCLLTDSGFCFLELNIGGGAGAAMEISTIAEHVQDASFFRSYLANSNVTYQSPAKAFCDCICRVAQDRGLADFTVGIIDWSPWFEKNQHHYEKLSNSLRRLGIKSLFGSQHDIKIVGDHLFLGGCKLDIILKVFMTIDLENYGADLARMDEITALECKGSVTFLNGLHTEVYSNKVNLALLQNFRERFSKEEQQIIDNSIPFTRVVRDQEVDFHGVSIDLLDHIARYRDNFVLKKGFSFAGRHVLFGASLSESEWTRKLEKALAGPEQWVVQERVQPLLIDALHVSNERVTSVPKPTIWSPYIFDHVPDGILIRFGDIDSTRDAISASNSTVGIAFHEA